MITREDIEDYEQEKSIQEWLKKENISGFKFTSITRNQKIKTLSEYKHKSLDDFCGNDANRSRLVDLLPSNNLENTAIDFDAMKIIIHDLKINEVTAKWMIKNLFRKVKTYRL